MGIVLFRVDERLIHGQVTVGWGTKLRAKRYLVVDDRLRDSDFERELFDLGVPPGAQAVFASVDEARAALPGWLSEAEPSILLTRDLDHVARLAEGGTLSGESVNLGGIHHAPGRRRVLSYLFLDTDDRSRIRELQSEGVSVSAQALPGTPVTPARRLLDD